ncbi:MULTISPECIES: HlyD family secretion protein [Enterobacter]|uniref:HlyD family secretion protein n=1 Tax=Enterobacter TaxID=547 RepID=UPI000FEBA437|nr:MULTISPECIES: HlyD family secretion protein [Enterobacter]MCR1303083.1 HlyD family secretion protein [Enterobacter sp. FL1277]MCR1307885.1 HlyD family secretion protein [Enterobacter sp. BT1271]MCR1314363.1 HlyD family secretion protein [Enterobacter sp. BT855]MCR1323070.1 HlyD family secretion protein [Enterobacter sp. BT1268]MCR1328526.1 HlyD family secretion protein [Enterobacter sp. BT1131]
MFRKEAIEYQSTRWEGKAVLLPGIPFAFIVLLSLFFIASISIFIAKGSYTRRVIVHGEITTFPGAVNISASMQGTVVKSFVSEGDRIKKGDALFLIHSGVSTQSGLVDENKKKEITLQINSISVMMANLISSKKRTLNALIIQKVHYQSSFNTSSELLVQAERELHQIEKNVNDYRSYQEKGLVTKDQMSSQNALLYQQQSNVSDLVARKSQDQVQVDMLNQQIQSQGADYDHQIYQLEQQKYELEKEKLNTEAEGNYVIEATADGLIDSINTTQGKMIGSGDVLARAQQNIHSPCYIETWVPDEVLPYLAIGQRVNVSYDAFPYEKFGQFRASISAISRVPASKPELLSKQTIAHEFYDDKKSWYKIMIKPDLQSVQVHGKQLSLSQGAKAQISLFLEKRRIYEWLLSPFYEMKMSVTDAGNE